MHTLFFGTFATYARCFVGIFSLSLVEATARAIQLGALGEVSGGTFAALEIPVWAARAGIFFVILGGGNPLHWQKGAERLQEYMKRPFGLPRVWRPMLIQAFLFSLFVLLANAGSELLAEAIASQGYAAPLNQTEPILFFFKNMIVIPLTLVFVYQAFCFMQENATKSK